MFNFRTDIEFARQLDAADELAAFRNEFVISDPNLIYLDGNSLGRLPQRTVELMQQAVTHGWGERLIRLWNDGWVGAPVQVGAKIAQLIGAQPDEVIVTDATSTNLFKLAAAALRARPDRSKIVSDVFNFPSDLYILQGIIDLLGNRHRLALIPSADSITIEPEAVVAAIDSDTALVTLSHVAFKSAFMYDMAAVTELAHRAGALVLWDLSHSTGAVPLDLNGTGVDLAVGCTYKYLNGGPGAPAFLYVRRDLQQQLLSPLWGWFSAQNPFAFELAYTPAPDITRFWGSTQPMLSLKAIEPAVDMVLEAGLERLRAKSVQQTEYLIFLTEEWLLPLGFGLGSPRRPQQRGSHVSLRHPEGYRINRALIDAEPPAPVVIPDFREPDNIRLGIAPLYTTFTEIHRAINRIRQIVERGIYQRYTSDRSAVT
ncbi:MAG: Kynureninase [Anaerolineae bacterium]|nr:Kynureninase [Anaerolineae bacterium]